MRQRYRHLIVAGTVEIVVTTAIPREMAETIWALVRAVMSPFLCENLKRLIKLSPTQETWQVWRLVSWKFTSVRPFAAHSCELMSLPVETFALGDRRYRLPIPPTLWMPPQSNSDVAQVEPHS